MIFWRFVGDGSTHSYFPLHLQGPHRAPPAAANSSSGPPAAQMGEATTGGTSAIPIISSASSNSAPPSIRILKTELPTSSTAAGERREPNNNETDDEVQIVGTKSGRRNSQESEDDPVELGGAVHGESSSTSTNSAGTETPSNQVPPPLPAPIRSTPRVQAGNPSLTPVATVRPSDREQPPPRDASHNENFGQPDRIEDPAEKGLTERRREAANTSAKVTSHSDTGTGTRPASTPIRRVCTCQSSSSPSLFE